MSCAAQRVGKGNRKCKARTGSGIGAGAPGAARRLVFAGPGVLLLVGVLVVAPRPAWAMHLAEGLLPAPWALAWWGVAVPFVWWGLRELKVRLAADPRTLQLTALVGAAVFVISCMPVPVPIAGSTAHACGVGLAAVLVGPRLSVVVASVALTLQALFLGHGGLTTLGANIVSMGVIGSFCGYFAFGLARRLRIPLSGAAFLGGLIADWSTYCTTSAELAFALREHKPMSTVFLALLAGFAPTQVPLGLLEGIVSAWAYRLIWVRRPELLALFGSTRSSTPASSGLCGVGVREST